MNPIKIENFKRSQPCGCFPEFRSLTCAECGEFRYRLAEILGIDPVGDGLLVLRRLHERPSIDLGIVPETGLIDVGRLVGSCGLRCGSTVYINWYRFDDIDEMSVVDLSHFFDDIWYPCADDIEIMDESMSWVFVVDHGGRMRFIRLDGVDGV